MIQTPVGHAAPSKRSHDASFLFAVVLGGDGAGPTDQFAQSAIDNTYVEKMLKDAK